MLFKFKRVSKKINYHHVISVFILAWLFLLSAGSHFSNSGGGKTVDEESGWSKVPEILKQIIPPAFPDRDFKITDYGAVGDGKTLCTESINKAVEECSRSGGGRVVVPKGIFLTGAIHLEDDVDLYVSDSAMLEFSTNPADYLPVVYTRWEGVELMNYSPLIYAFGKRNVAVTGRGILNGQADNEHWWPWKGGKEFGWKQGMQSQLDSTCRPLLMRMGDNDVPVKDRIFGDHHFLRPTFVEFYNCESVLIQGVTLENAPFWFLHPTLCRNVTIDGIKTDSDGPNTDGCDPESCSGVLIENCVFNDGDDCIAIKSGRNEDGRRVNVPVENIIIRDCAMKEGHGAVSIGSEISGGCSNIFVEDCSFDSPHLDQGIRIKSNAKRGGALTGIYVRNLKIGQVRESIVRITMNYDPPEAEGYKYFPVMKNIFAENVVSQKSEYGLYFDGLPESKIENVSIKDCKFDGVSKGDSIVNAIGVRLEKVYVNGSPVHDEDDSQK
ncbi:MAG TPA: glycoside hydrolase family 28 protein [Candidatus Acidoferrales bacterium]|nr:glycoside hydrolase family 28 protein [Candidatus Acidoferrales bacterium]